MKVAIRRVDLASLGKFGCLLGVVAAFVPSLLCGMLGLGVAGILGRWLQGWQEITISILGQDLASIDLVHTLGLEQLMELLQVLANASAPILFLVVLTLALISGIILAVIIALVGLGYNLLAAATGGLVVEMSDAKEKHPTD